MSATLHKTVSQILTVPSLDELANNRHSGSLHHDITDQPKEARTDLLVERLPCQPRDPLFVTQEIVTQLLTSQ